MLQYNLKELRIFRRFIQHARRGQTPAIRVSDGAGTGGHVAGIFRGKQTDTGDMRKRKMLGKGRNNNGTKEKQTALCLVHPCGLLHPAGGDSGTHQ